MSKTKISETKSFKPTTRIRQQVAAVCYRCNKRRIEFLLVHTRGGRWTFPKGGVEPGLTPAQSAAMEAVEEAGVHGRIEELAFSRYKHISARDNPDGHPAIMAHLCEVTSLQSPKEPGRQPTWFPAAKAKQRLKKRRAPESATELAGVVDRAVQRIQRIHRIGEVAAAAPSPLRRSASVPSPLDSRNPDALQRVRLEAMPEGRAIFLARRFGRPVLQLGTGDSNPQQQR